VDLTSPFEAVVNTASYDVLNIGWMDGWMDGEING